MRFPLRRRAAPTAEERADAHWSRLKNRTAAVGLVGVFKDITPGAEAQKATFAYERIREDEIGSEGDDTEGEKKFIVFADRRPNPLDDDAEPFSVKVPKPDPEPEPEPEPEPPRSTQKTAAGGGSATDSPHPAG